MDSLYSFILDNKDWLFSGLGIAVLSLVISVLLNKIKKKPQTVRGDLNIQVGKNIDINIGSMTDQDIITKIKQSNQANSADTKKRAAD